MGKPNGKIEFSGEGIELTRALLQCCKKTCSPNLALSALVNTLVRYARAVKMPHEVVLAVISQSWKTHETIEALTDEEFSQLKAVNRPGMTHD